MDMLKTALFTISLLGVAVWVGLVWKAEGDERLVEACRPVSMVTVGIQNLSTALLGFTPNWTLSLRQFSESSCYYFFSVVLSAQQIDSAGVPQGSAGVRP